MMEVTDTKVGAELDWIRGYVDLTQSEAFLLALMTLRYLEENPGEYVISDKAKWSNINAEYDLGNETIFLRAFNQIESDNPSLIDVFTSLHLPKLDKQGLFVIFNFIDNLNLTNTDAGHTFEIFLNALLINDKQKGTFGTSKELARLISYLLDVKGGDCYDGTSGSSQLLIEMAKKALGEGNSCKLWGQEFNSTMWSIGVMNMIIHEIPFESKKGDVLSNPLFISEKGVQQFDYVAMDAPFSLSWKQMNSREIEFDTYRRFTYGLPGKSKADWLFIQHALASLKESGKAAVIVSLGILSSGGTDKKIREKMIQADLIESIIVLPSNILSYSSIPTAIIIFRKKKSEDRKGKIQFINATNQFVKEKRKNILTQANIDTIVRAYNDLTNVKNFKIVIPIKNIKDSNLNYATYFESNELDSLFGKVEVNKNEYENTFAAYTELNRAGTLFRGIQGKAEDRPGSLNDYYLVQVSDIQDGQIILETLSPIVIDVNKAVNFQIQEGDLLISSRGSSIKFAVVPSINMKLVLSQNLICFRPKEGINPYFVKAFLESPVGMSYLASSQTGSTATALNVKDLETIKIPEISASEQAEIGLEIKKADTALQEALQKAKNEYVEKYKGIYQHMRLTEAFNLIEERRNLT